MGLVRCTFRIQEDPSQKSNIYRLFLKIRYSCFGNFLELLDGLQHCVSLAKMVKMYMQNI